MIEFLSSSPFAFIGVFVLISLVLGAGIDWVRRQQVRDRHKVPAKEFGKTFFADNEQVANRVREVLAAHAGVEPDVVRADDRLDDDLDLDVGANPDLFFEFEEALGIDCHIDKFKVFEATTAGLRTVRDLVAFVAERVEEAQAGPAPPKRAEPRIDGADIVMIGWFVGLALMVVGGAMRSQRILAIGLLIAFAPLTFGLGRVLVHVLRDFIVDARDMGLRELMRHPFSMIGWLVMTGFLVLAFGAGLYLVLKGLTGQADFGA